jgi:hypothetical protein
MPQTAAASTQTRAARRKPMEANMRLCRRLITNSPAFSAFLAGLAIFTTTLPAKAAVYNLEYNGSGLGPLAGTVTVTAGTGVHTGQTEIDVALNSGYTFHQTTASNHNAFAFDTSPLTSVDASTLPAGFSVVSGGPFSAPPFELTGGVKNIWSNAISASSTGATSLDFYINGGLGVLTTQCTNFGGSPNPNCSNGSNIPPAEIWFVADLVDPTGATGNWGADLCLGCGHVGAPGPTPGAGFAGLALLLVAGVLAKARGLLAR